MKNLIYFWVDKYRSFKDPNTHATKYLFDDFGISLSSKYKVTHTLKRDGTLKFDVNETKIKRFFEADSDDERFYSERISDIKAIAGKNGAGKTTLLELLSFVISGNENWIVPDASLKYCILWIDDDGSFENGTNEKNPAAISEINFNSLHLTQIDAVDYKKNVIYYSAVFNDEWRYSYPRGGCPKLQDIRTQYLIEQDIENFNNNPDMYGLKDRLTCHSIMESIRQVKFVSKFRDKEDFLSSIFVLPDKVYFSFSEGSLRNQIHSFLEKFSFDGKEYTDDVAQITDIKSALEHIEDVNENESNQDAMRKKVEDKWIKFFFKTNDLKIRIRFALVFAYMSKRPNLNSDSWDFEEIEDNLDDEKCKKLLDDIQLQLSIHIPSDVEDNLFDCLVHNCEGNSFEFNLPSRNAEKLLEIIFELNLHVPFMEMKWDRLLSSGESCYLRLFSRLYDSILREKRYHQIRSLQAVFVIDEVDLYLHPEWQRCWLANFIQGIKLIQDVAAVNLNLHLVLATHSPFMLTDFSSESIARLSREEDFLTKAQNSESSTLAANIFDFLEGDFFLDSSIGEHVRKKIKDLVDEIDRTNKAKLPLSDYSKMIINNIGDPIIKTLLVNRKGLQYDND